MSTKQYVAIVIVIVISTLSAFYSGFFLKGELSKQSEKGGNSTVQKYKPNFIDELIITTKETPRKTLILSGIRTFSNDTTNNYTIKVFYFNGDYWIREISEGKFSEDINTIPKTNLVPNWIVKDDPSYMLKQSVSGDVSIKGNLIKFEIPTIFNEISVRSSPKYTKFMSEGEGVITINGLPMESKILYSRIYSFNPPESLVFTSDPAGIETEWLAIWDDDGNFHSIDETVIDNKKTFESYKAHSLGIIKDNKNRVQKSFLLNLQKNGLQKYSVQIKDGINETISVSRTNSINKAVNGTDLWHTGQVEAQIKTAEGKMLNGFGVFEQISQ